MRVAACASNQESLTPFAVVYMLVLENQQKNVSR